MFSRFQLVGLSQLCATNSPNMHVCLPACMLACLPACVRACLVLARCWRCCRHWYAAPTLVCCWCGDDPKLKDHDSRRLDSKALSFRAPRGSPARVNHQLESPLTCEQATCEVLDMRHFNLTDPRLEILSKNEASKCHRRHGKHGRYPRILATC